MSLIRLWLYRLRYPCFCTRCDQPCRRSHYRRCPANAVPIPPWFIPR